MPSVPIDWIVGVLQQIRAGFVDERVGMGHISWFLTVTI